MKGIAQPQLVLSAQRPGLNAQVGQNYPCKCQLQDRDYLQCTEQMERMNSLLGLNGRVAVFVFVSTHGWHVCVCFLSNVPGNTANKVTKTTNTTQHSKAQHSTPRTEQILSKGRTSLIRWAALGLKTPQSGALGQCHSANHSREWMTGAPKTQPTPHTPAHRQPHPHKTTHTPT